MYINSRFGLVIGCLVLSVMLSSDPENKEISRIIYFVDAVILFQYILEFSVRVWVVGCNAKYRGVRLWYKGVLLSLERDIS